MSDAPNRCLRAAVPITLLTALVATVALMTLLPPDQRAAAQGPKATAGFQTVDDLVLAVDLPAAKKERPDLKLELLDRDGNVLEAQAPKLPGKDAASLRVAFKRPKEKLGHLKVRLTSGKTSSVVAVGDILLSKAHETTLSASSDLFAGGGYAQGRRRGD